LKEQETPAAIHRQISKKTMVIKIRQIINTTGDSDSLYCYAPDRKQGAISVAFVRPSVSPSVAYIANNLRTRRPSVPRFGRKVPHFRCDSHTSFKVKKSKVSVRGGRGAYRACFQRDCLSLSLCVSTNQKMVLKTCPAVWTIISMVVSIFTGYNCSAESAKSH